MGITWGEWKEPAEYHLGMRLRHHYTQEEGVLEHWDRDRELYVVRMATDNELVIGAWYDWDTRAPQLEGGQ